MGTGKETIFLTYGSLWKNKYPQILNCLTFGLFYMATMGL